MKIKCVSNMPTLGDFGVSKYITPGKVYECDDLGGGLGKIKDDAGIWIIIIITDGDCAHGKWEVVEE